MEFKEAIEEIEKRIDIVDVVTYLGLRKGSGSMDSGSYFCPLHEDSKPSFVAKKGYHTWKCLSGCGSGNIYTLLQKTKKLKFKEALQEASFIAKLDLNFTKFKSKLEEAEEILKILNPLHVKYSNEKRGISLEYIQDIKSNKKIFSSGKYIVFPIIYNGSIETYKFISVLDKRDKFFKGNNNSCKFFPDNNFFEIKELFITAGEWDCLILDSKVKQEKRKDIKVVSFSAGEGSYPLDLSFQLKNAKSLECIRIFYDNDEAGKTGALKLADKLSILDIPVYIYYFPKDKPKGYDVNDFFKEYHTLGDILTLEFFQYETNSGVLAQEQDLELERAILLYILINNEALKEAIFFNLRINDFKDWRFQKIYKKIIDFIETFGYCDIDLLYSRLSLDKQVIEAVDLIVGARYLGSLEEFQDYIEQVQDSSYNILYDNVLNDMKLIRFSKTIRSDKQIRTVELLEKLLINANIHDKAKSMKEMILDWVNNFESQQNQLMYIPTPFDSANGVLNGGLRLGKVHLLSAPVSMGKSTYSSDFLEHASKEGIRSCGYIYEADHSEETEIFLSKRSGINNFYFKRKILPNEETPISIKEKYMNDTDNLLSFVDGYDFVFSELINDIKMRVLRDKTKFFVIDQLNSIATEGGSSRKEFLTRCMQMLSKVAKKYNICILLLCQLTRSASKERGLIKPGAEDIAETADLERLAYTIMIITAESRNSRKIKILYPKNRNGVADIDHELIFEREYSRFKDLI